MTNDEEIAAISKMSLTIQQAIDVLNRFKHGGSISPTHSYSPPWKWARYKDCSYVSGVGMTNKLRAKYTTDYNRVEESPMLSDFDAIAIAEAYLKYAAKG